jgi:hypothetical protein
MRLALTKLKLALTKLTRFRAVAGEIGTPVGTFYTLHFLGATDWVALLTATFAAGARLLFSAVRHRKWSMFSTMMLIAFGTSLSLAFVNQDPRFLVLKGCLTTSVCGLAYLVSVAVGHPLSVPGAQAFFPDRAEQIAFEYKNIPYARRCHRVVSLVWGFGLIGEGLVQMPVIFSLPIEIAVGISATQSISVTLGLIVWNLYYDRRSRRKASMLLSDPPFAAA